MNTKEVANIIIRLRQEGWTEEKINDFIIFVETHVPTADEAEKAKNSNR
ncbi:MAG: hypothetical protein IJU93_02135 [Lachnospiraceae bacterium]|nr:hypothetical protein [Lachnospiraceae bacterium]